MLTACTTVPCILLKRVAKSGDRCQGSMDLSSRTERFSNQQPTKNLTLEDEAFAFVLPERCRWLVVVFEAQVGDEIGAHDVAKGVFELHRLDEKIVLGVKAFAGLRRLEIEAEPLLNAN